MRLIDSNNVMCALIEHGQRDTKFKLSETIRYTPSEVQKIIDEDMIAMDGDDIGLYYLREIKKSLWEDTKKYLDLILTQDHPILIDNTIAANRYYAKARRVEALTEAINVIEEWQKENKH